ncbi:AI-2E family transporter [Bombilactobacillus folatiphilus]|uniref:AI-2E family transporter n=1 Tax=Bombilactobacillus folatiphilus TaxID=2923362 RepID=A0ABY4P7P2_9LACO|nr:AI-2E family transporter [Bombilactobacillus folatiphilus]UQS81725.1 AI-2E family transporter [Bombilactobacillus folatiphilus]
MKQRTWFTKWFLNNKFTVVLLNILLTFLIIAVFAKISYVFRPLWQILGIICPPLIVAAIMYYLIKPLINLLENKLHFKRLLAISLVFLVIILIVLWAVLTLIPIIQSQTASLIKNLPHYWHMLQQAVNDLAREPHLRRLHIQDNLSWNKISQSFMHSIGGTVNIAWSNFTSAISIVSNTVMIILTAPFILFFLLKDEQKIKPSILQFIPDRLKAATSQTLSEINAALSSYIRGQLTVAFWVAIMFSIGYLIAGLPYGALLGIFAGICNLIPYVGSAIGLLPAIILALLSGHHMIFIVIIIFVIEQTIETRVVSPLVVGNKMNMHPVTTIFVLLVSGGMFGLIGVIGGIPSYAILKILFTKTFSWFQANSNWYQEKRLDRSEDQSKT